MASTSRQSAERRQRNERQLSLLAALSARGALTKDDIRALTVYATGSDAAFGRTFERDLQQLRQAGYPIRTDSEYRYHYDGRAPLATPVSALDAGLLRSILSGLDHRSPHMSLAASGLQKLLAVAATGEANAEYLHAGIPTGENIVDLARAVQLRRRVSFEYEGTTGPKRDYLLEPAEISVHFEAFYVSGSASHCPAVSSSDSLADESQASSSGETWHWRTFRVSRITAGSLRDIGKATEQHRQGTSPQGVFTAAEAIVAIRPGCAVPLAARGTPVGVGELTNTCGTTKPSGEDWEYYRYSDVDRQRLFEDLFLYGRDVRLVGDDTLVAQWKRRVEHLAALGRDAQ